MEYCRSEGSWWCYWGLHAHSQNCPLHQGQSESLPLLSLVQRTGCSPAASIRQFSVYVPLEVKMQSWSQKKWEENICNSKAPWGGKDGHWEGLFSCQVIYISRWESRSVIIYSSRFWKHKNKGSWRTGYHINSAFITDNKNIQRWILTLKKRAVFIALCDKATLTTAFMLFYCGWIGSMKYHFPMGIYHFKIEAVKQ